MDKDLIEKWLNDQKSKMRHYNTFLGISFILIGTFMMFVIFWSIYFLSLSTLGKLIGPSILNFIPTDVLHVGLAFGTILCLFIGNVLSSSELLTQYSVKVNNQVIRFAVPGMRYRVKMDSLKDKLLNVIYIAPQMIFNGLRMIKQGRRLKDLDVDSCSKVLTVLYRNEHVVSFDNIIKKVDEINPHIVFNQLFDTGSIRLQRDNPSGLELRKEARQHIQFYLQSK